jgi:hypothetical protein
MAEKSGEALPFIKGDNFGLNTQLVVQYTNEAARNLEAARQSLSDSHPKIREYAERKLPNIERVAETFKSTKPKEILNLMQSIYDRVEQLGSSGTGEDEIVRQISQEFSDFDDYYGLLRKTAWGIV